MFTRVVELTTKPGKHKQLADTINDKVLPILKKQPGFLEILPLGPETKTEKSIIVTLWAEKRDAERYEREVYPKVEGIVKPYLTTPVTFKHYNVETTLCQHFVEALTA